MTALRPYPAYKDSGVDWLGDVPEHWEVRRLQYLAALNPDTLPETTDPLKSFDYVDIGSLGTDVMVRRPESMTFGSAPSRARRVVREGDTIISTVRTYLKAVFHFRRLERPTIASTGFLVIRPNGKAGGRFLSRAIVAEGFVDEVVRHSVGVSYPAITETVLSKLPLPLPPLDEQRAIADFLDGMDARITRFLAARRRMIALLEEQKQAVINQAVTRGLDPDVPLKDSGVDWLGEIPAHWDVLALRRITQSRCDGPFGSGLTSSHYSDEGVRVVRLQNIRFAEFNGSDAAFIPADYYATLGDHDVRGGDILIAGLGDANYSCGRACVAPADIEPAMVKADCFRFRIMPMAANLEYLALHLSATAVDLSAALSTGSTRQRVNLQKMSNREIALPPANEQQAIVDHIDRETSRIEALISRYRREIDLMQEYRTRLISDVVTGKLDVRGLELPPVKAVIGEEIEAAMEEAPIPS